MTVSIWGDDNIDEWLTQVEIALDEWDQNEVCDCCGGDGVVEVAEYEENGDEHFSEMECEFCFGTGYEGGMN